ncbi:MAG: FAD/NAD(P)-binding oxidoreductase [Bacillota bacterium]
MANVVVVGGGTGGAAAARSLAARLSGKHKVTLVEKEAEVFYQPSFLQLMVGRRQISDLSRSIANLRGAGVDVVIDRLSAVDADRRQIRLEKDKLSYDVLVLAAGADASIPDPPELGKSGFNLYTPDGALKIWEAVEKLESGEVVLVAAALPFKCPPALYEAALILRSFFTRRGRWGNISITVYSPETTPSENTGIRPSRYIMRALSERGIQLHCDRHLESVDVKRKLLRFSDGQTANFDLLFYIPRHHCPEFVRKSGMTDESGWVAADPLTLRTGFPDIYAIGDVNQVRLPSGHTLYKAGAVAHFQGLVAADNIAARLLGHEPKRLFGGKSGCVIDAGDTAFAMAGDIYRRKPNFIMFPSSRGWLAVKWLTERQWLRYHG